MRARTLMLVMCCLLLMTSVMGGVEAARKGGKGKGPQAPKGSPNVVIFLTDDMRESDWQALPQTRALLKSRGTWFPNFFTVNPSCCPSRTTILTGMHSHNNGVLQNSGANGGYDAFQRNKLERQTIAFKLDRRGYRTALIGKYLNGYSGKGRPPAGWDEWYATSTLDYLNFTLNENGKQKTYRGSKNYLTDVMRKQAVRFIDTTPKETPLFLYLSLKAPHVPAISAPRDRNAYRGATVDRIPSLNEEDVSDKPAYVQSMPLLDLAQLDRDEQRRLASLRSADAAIAAVIRELRAEGRLDNTYIFVFSDNGWMRGEHRLLTKAYPYDSSVRIPMLAYGPGFPAGATDERLTATIDIAPTIAAAARVKLPRADGKNLLGDWSRDDMLMESWGTMPWKALRGRDFLYVEYAYGDREYYDYDKDPYELLNLLSDKAGDKKLSAQEAQDLSSRLASVANCKRPSWCP